MTPGQFYKLCMEHPYIVVPPVGHGEPYGVDDLAEAVDLGFMERALAKVEDDHGPA